MKKTSLGFALLFIAVASCSAAGLSANDVISKASAVWKEIPSFKANLVMTSNTEDVEIRSRGKIFHAKPDKYRIELFTPKKQSILIDKNSIESKDIASGIKLKQIFSKLAEKDVLSLPAIFDITKQFESYNFEVQDQNRSSILLKGTPKEKGLIGKIDVYVDSKDFFPSRIVYYNAKGTLLGLKEIQYSKIGTSVLPVKCYATLMLHTGSAQSEIEYQDISIEQNLPEKLFIFN